MCQRNRMDREDRQSVVKETGRLKKTDRVWSKRQDGYGRQTECGQEDRTVREEKTECSQGDRTVREEKTRVWSKRQEG